MKRNVLALGLLTAMCIVALLESNGQPNPLGFDNYITISNGEFMDGDSIFKPLFVNYRVDYACNISNPQNKIYYIAPHFNYCNIYRNQRDTEINDTIYPNGHFGYGANGNIEMNRAKSKLDHDLKIIDSLGFNVVRIAPAIYWRNDSLRIPTKSYTTYFELTDTLIAKCTRHNLRVILVLEADSHAFSHFDQLCVYLDSVSRHYSSNKTVMAYVVFAEPGYKWKATKDKNNDKLLISNWSITSIDKYYAGDLDGDGYDELLCVQNKTNTWADIYRYNPQQSNNPWQYVWTNSGNGQIGSWTYQSNDIILPGRFTDSTFCSLMCIRKNGKQTAAMCQRLSSGSWGSLWSASNLFNPVHIGSWEVSDFDKYHVGDFNGDGIDELFCTQITNGTSDRMTLLQYNTSWNTLWTNNGISEGVGIYPYRAHLHVGNFDSDRADEILGIGSWATKFDFNTSNQWDWSWSTYDSGRLSDWSVTPSDRIFFMKVMTDVPDYLFVSKWISIPIIPDIYLFSAYSYDP